ncbi:hypothetical protein N9747_04790 [Planktomarina sp.]|nr:hypothetical protein [Planktomarina sp.]
MPPLSLVLDHKGIYFDPKRSGDFDCQQPAPTSTGAAELQNRLITGGISNYNPRQSAALSLRPCRRVLVPGQVNDDALIHLGTRNICTNLALLRRTHEQNPDAILVYKRHPDVKVGLQPSALSEEAQYYDIIAADHDTISSKVRGMKFGR